MNPPGSGGFEERSGGVLLFHTVSRAVPSALAGLTSEFEMGSGVTLPLLPPETVRSRSAETTAWFPRGARPSNLNLILQETHIVTFGCFPEGKQESAKPHGRLVRVSSTPRGASTSRLSPRSLRGAFRGLRPGDLILRGASRLDAFSGYPVRTWLPSDATGVTTGSLEVRPTRSSRTKVSSSQTSYACGR